MGTGCSDMVLEVEMVFRVEEGIHVLLLHTPLHPRTYDLPPPKKEHQHLAIIQLLSRGFAAPSEREVSEDCRLVEGVIDGPATEDSTKLLDGNDVRLTAVTVGGARMFSSSESDIMTTSVSRDLERLMLGRLRRFRTSEIGSFFTRILLLPPFWPLRVLRHPDLSAMH
ncbi:hypothetical protein BDQ17DRAFT_1429998 [Cyathus striatus]|nr:hypothetical protein BDQ17DRAFT_1429998 [Cyathus striatus]